MSSSSPIRCYFAEMALNRSYIYWSFMASWPNNYCYTAESLLLSYLSSAASAYNSIIRWVPPKSNSSSVVFLACYLSLAYVCSKILTLLRNPSFSY